jgi:hypothetical protein
MQFLGQRQGVALDRWAGFDGDIALGPEVYRER